MRTNDRTHRRADAFTYEPLRAAQCIDSAPSAAVNINTYYTTRGKVVRALITRVIPRGANRYNERERGGIIVRAFCTKIAVTFQK